MKKLLTSLFFFSSLLFSDNQPLTDFFSAVENPGTGILKLASPTQKEEIIFGKETGIYGLGMVLKPNSLPASYQKEFKNTSILQIAFGTLKEKALKNVPQFGAATLLGQAKSFEKLTRFLFVVPSDGKTAGLKNTALLLFSSPKTPVEQSNEEKLKGTYFAQTGNTTIAPVGASKKMIVKSNEESIDFISQMMEMQIDAVLSTPFNNAETTIKGKIQFPVYTPDGKEAEKWTAQIASQSLTPEPEPSKKRDLSSKPRGK